MQGAVASGMSSSDVMGLLADIDRRSQQAAELIPEAVAAAGIWDGLAYSLGGVRLVSAMNEVAEMLTYPDAITPVPGTKRWMLGLANVRGNLLPVIDLQMFLGVKPVVPNKQARMLVIRQRGLTAGLLVPSVQGMRHFNEENRMPNARMNGALGVYVYDAFAIDNDIWPVFNMVALAADPEFRVAGI